MAVGIEDILLLKAQQDAQDSNLGTGAAVGAGLGAIGGVSLGELANRLSPQTQMSTMSPGGVGRALKPGHRMAGGLVGLILGGGLGAGTAEMMKQNSPAAQLLAKLQVQGTLTASEEASLQNILADAYSQTIG